MQRPCQCRRNPRWNDILNLGVQLDVLCLVLLEALQTGPRLGMQTEEKAQLEHLTYTAEAEHGGPLSVPRPVALIGAKSKF